MEDIRTWLQTAVKNYDSGVKLYLKYGSNSSLKSLFTAEDESDFKRAKLIQVLADLAGAANPENPQKTSAAAAGSLKSLNQHTSELQKAISNAPVDSDRFCALRRELLQNKIELVKAEMAVDVLSTVSQKRSWSIEPIADPIENALHAKWKPLYAELMSLQHRVYDIALLGGKGDSSKKLEACQAAHRIIDLDEQIEGIYQEREHYHEHGRLPDTDTKKEVVGDPVRWATELNNLRRYARDYRLKLSKDPNNKKAPKWAQKLADIDADIARYKKLLKLDDEAA